ncbi:hypothetical protein M0R72_01885 [Candidatus Pacearchaeota archaeon]|jgi:hypothetical protein|nr:hypothetical protein [Candidatus Pacearchaeota archaeon]
MKLKGNTSVQGLLGDRFSNNPPRGYSDQLIVERIEPEPGEIKQQVPFAFSKEEKIAVYQDLKGRLEDGQDPGEIARDVLACMEEHMKEKQAEAYGETNSKLKGGKGKFRRVE